MYASQSIFHERKTGGTKRFGELYRYLRDKADCECDLCCDDKEEDLKANNAEAAFRIVNNKESFLNRFLTRDMVVPFYNRKTLKNIKNADYDEVISFDVPPTVCLCRAGVKNVVLMVRRDFLGYEEVMYTHKSLRRSIKRLGMWITEDICLRKCSKIIVQCKYDKKALIRRHIRLRKKLEAKTFIQINNVNPSWTQAPDNGTGFVLPEPDAFNICFIGNFDDIRKGHDILLEAAVKMKELNIRFHIIGGGKQQETFKEEYESDKIVFYGHSDNPLELMMQCDLVIVPSKADSCPNTVLEALYCKIPVIACRAGGIPEILKNKDALFEPTAEDLEKAVRRLYESPADLRKLKQQQLKRSKELTFDWAEKMSGIILEK